MNERSKDLVSYRMARAEETLEDARILAFSQKQYDTMVENLGENGKESKFPFSIWWPNLDLAWYYSVSDNGSQNIQKFL